MKIQAYSNAHSYAANKTMQEECLKDSAMHAI